MYQNNPHASMKKMQGVTQGKLKSLKSGKGRDAIENKKCRVKFRKVSAAA